VSRDQFATFHRGNDDDQRLPNQPSSRQTRRCGPERSADRASLVVALGKGELLWAEDDRRYIDFVGGIGVMNVGHCHPKVVAAVQAQAERLTHAAFQVAAYDTYVLLAERLNKSAALGEPAKTVFLTTGAGAVENAVKIARAHTNRPGVVAFTGGFHGRTLMGMSLTGMSAPYKQDFGPFAPDTYYDGLHGRLAKG
jgi:4-aminobutyrate aminotransferase / (S)-3-amino-2-methylpropionate transaminase / 5-aminovalerate transaminase